MFQNNLLHTSALKSLKSLCMKESIRDLLYDFLFEENTALEDDGEEKPTFMKILTELMSRKSLKVEAISLFKAMEKLKGKREHSIDMRSEVYLNIFSGSRKVILETFELMKMLNDDFWVQVIQLLLKDEEKDFPQLLDQLEGIKEIKKDTGKLLSIVTENINDKEMSRCAAYVFIEVFKRQDDENKEEILEALESSLQLALVDEQTFALLLDVFQVIDIEKLTSYYNQNAIRLMSTVHWLSVAFEKFESQLALYNLVHALKKLTKVSPQYMIKEVRLLFNKFYLEMLNVSETLNENQRLSVLWENPISKLTILLENRAWNLMNYNQMEIIYRLNLKFFENPDDSLFPNMAHFSSNFFKHMWARVVLNLPLPLSNEDMADDIENFVGLLAEQLDNSDKPLKSFCALLCSFLDMTAMFQPEMRKRHKHDIFKLINKVELKKETIKDIAEIIANIVFVIDDKGDSDGKFQRQLILQTWIAFNKSFSKLDGRTSSEKIIRHYRLKSPYKAELEILMELLIQEKNIFEQCVAIIGLTMSTENDLPSFRAFYQALEHLTARHFKGERSKRLGMAVSVCSSLLGKLLFHVDQIEKDEKDDRMRVLDVVSIVTRNMDTPIKQTLIEFIPKDLENADLTDTEKKHLEAFKESLKN